MVTNFSEFVGQVLLLPVPSPIPLTPRKRGDPKDASLGTNSLARVVIVSSRDSRSHRELLVSHAWQETIRGIPG